VVFGFFAVQLSGVYFAMLTLAFAQIVWSIAFQWVAVTGGDNGILGVCRRNGGSPSHFYWLSIGVAHSAWRAAHRGILSVWLCAAGDARLAPAQRGDRDRRQARAVDRFVIAGTVAGIAGALFAYSRAACFRTALASRSRSMRW